MGLWPNMVSLDLFIKIMQNKMVVSLSEETPGNFKAWKSYGLDFLPLDVETIKRQDLIAVAVTIKFGRYVEDWHLCSIKVLQLVCLWIVGFHVFKGKTVDEALLTAGSCSFWPWEIQQNSQNWATEGQIRGRTCNNSGKHWAQDPSYSSASTLKIVRQEKRKVLDFCISKKKNLRNYCGLKIQLNTCLAWVLRNFK